MNQPAVNALVAGSARAPARRNRERLAWTVAGASVVLVLILVSLFAPRTPREEAPELRLDVTTPPTSDPYSLAISPDGRRPSFATACRHIPPASISNSSGGRNDHSQKAFCLLLKVCPLLSFPGEELLQQRSAFRIADAANDFEAVIQAGIIENVVQRAGCAALRVRGAEDEAGDSGMNHGAGTHRARFDGAV